MIKALASDGDDDTQKIMILGLSRENMRRLLDGQPIEIDWRKVGQQGLPHVIILGGETEGDIVTALERYGAITDDTQISHHHNVIDIAIARARGHKANDI